MRAHASILALFLFLLSCSLHAEEVLTYKLELGESKKIALDGLNPFVSDETVVGLNVLNNGNIVIIALSPGSTDLLYWKEAELISIPVEVVVPETIGNRTNLPSIEGDKPFFIYNLFNSSTYTDKTFFISPSYFHSLHGNFPNVLSGNAHAGVAVIQPTSYRSATLSNATVQYGQRGLTLSAGNTSASVSNSSGGGFQGSGFTGATVKFDKPQRESSAQHTFLLAGGFAQASDLLKTTTEEQVYMSKYSYTWPRKSKESLSADAFNVGIYSFKDHESNKYNFGEVLGGSFHFTPHFSLETGVNQNEKSFAAAISPSYLNNKLFSSSSYSYSRHGLRSFRQGPTGSDDHNLGFSLQKAFSDYQTFLSTYLAGALTQPYDGSQSSNVETSSITLQKYFSVRRSYALGHSFARSESAGQTNIVNSSFTQMSYPISAHGSLSHGLSYSRQDAGNRAQSASFSNSFSSEALGIAYGLSASSGVQITPEYSQSASASASLEYQRSSFKIGSTANYSRPNIRKNLNLITASMLLSWNITPNYFLSLVNSSSYTSSPTAQFSGNVALQLSSYFGPGIKRHSIKKALSPQRGLVDVTGVVFLDKNFSAFLDSTDQRIPQVAILIDQKQQVVTDEHGNFEINGLKPGNHSIQIIAGSLTNVGEILEPPQQISFTTGARENTQIFLPVTQKRAKIYVHMLLDSNNNGVVDENDIPSSVHNIIVTSHGQEPRQIDLRQTSLVSGMDIGPAIIAIDPMAIPDDATLIGSYEQTLMITDYTDYTMTFLFAPLRTLTGKIISPTALALEKLVLSLGSIENSVAADGSFWLQNLLPGDYEITVKNLPAGYCIEPGQRTNINVPDGVMIESRYIHLTTECSQPAQP